MDWVRTPVTFPSKTLGSWASLLIPLGFSVLSSQIKYHIGFSLKHGGFGDIDV